MIEEQNKPYENGKGHLKSVTNLVTSVQSLSQVLLPSCLNNANLSDCCYVCHHIFKYIKWSPFGDIFHNRNKGKNI